MPEPFTFTRRRFLQYSAVGAGTLALSPYLTKLRAFAAPPVADNQGILITIQLAGGNDGMNMIAPVGDPTYASLRNTLRITNGLSIGSGLVMHPAMVKTKARFDQGKVAVVRGVGYQPPDLSHFTSTDIWMHGWGGTNTPDTGWVGRFLDTLPNTNHESLYAVSLHGDVNPHLVGDLAHPSSLPLGIDDAFGINRSDPSQARLFDAVQSYGTGSSDLGDLGDLYDQTAMELMQLTQRIKPAYGFTQQPTDIQQQLVLAAHLINANLGIRVFDTELDGFDTHSDQHDWHATLLGQLDAAIDAFFAALAPRWRGQVTLMTFSEFGRRPEENGDAGTDHGTASPLLVIGDHVNGGLLGGQPSLTNLDEDGNLVPTVDFRAVYASVLHSWLGADDHALLGKAYASPSLFASGPSNASVVGYWLAGPGGSVHGFGGATKFSSLSHLARPIVAGVATASHRGMWLCGGDGGIFTFGDARYLGGEGGKPLNKPVVAMAATPSGKGYWLCASDGGIFTFGDARYLGGEGGKPLNKPIVDMAATPTGRGYWLVASDGGIFTFGDAKFHGSTGGVRLSSPVVGMARTPSGNGYWLCTSSGTIYPFGDAKSHGSRMSTSASVCSIAASPTGKGYWLGAIDGTVGAFGDAPVLGSVHDSTAVLVST